MITRRGMFGFLRVAGAVATVPALVGGVALFDPGRRVTHLPGGGTLIEDEKFTTGIQLSNCNDVSLTSCSVVLPGQRALQWLY